MSAVLDAQRVLVRAIWSCIVDASSMNVVMSGREVNSAIRGLKTAVVAAERARIADAVRHELALVSANPVPWEAGAAAAYHWTLAVIDPKEETE